jgi:iron(III) transport system ATP-binding protein
VVEAQGLRKSFAVKEGEVKALCGVDLSIEDGEFAVLLGPSGSGKTTLLRCIAGLETPDEGEIRIAGKTVLSRRERVVVPPEERPIGMVFQSYAVWPHLTVYQNVAVPLSCGRKKIARALVRERAMEALRLVQLESVADRPVPHLSGGQQQRVALARALAVSPRLVLMDEPLSNLDARLREEMRAQIKELALRLSMTVLYVTHDQVEAMVLADRISVMSRGEIISSGTAEELYEAPQRKDVAEFFGSINWLEVLGDDGGAIRTAIGSLNVAEAVPAGASLVAAIRPEDVAVRLAASSAAENEFAGEILTRTFLGDQVIYTVQVNGQIFHSRTASRERLGGKVFLRLPREKIRLFPRQDPV